MARVFGSIMKYSTRLFVDWSVSGQSSSGNYSDISWTYGYYFHLGSHNLANASVSWTEAPGGTSGASSWTASGLYHEWEGGAEQEDYRTFHSGSVRVFHDADGSATVRLQASTGNATDGSTSTLNVVLALPTIAVLPSAPGKPSASGHNDSDPTTATISWTAPDVIGSGLNGTYIEVARNSTFTDIVDWADLGSWVTSRNLTGLPKGTTLYVRVKARNSVNWGAWSPTGSFVTSATVPGAPGTPAFANVGTSSFDVLWTPPADNGGRTITQYRLEVKGHDDETWPVSSPGVVTLSGTSLNVTGKSPNTTFDYRVRCTNAIGNSAYSSVNSVTTGATTPGAPAGPTVTSITATEAQVDYSAPASTGGSSITGYDVQRATNSTFTAGVATFSDSASPYVLSNLLPGTDYWVRVRAKNAVGNGAWSPSETFKTLSGVHMGNGSLWVDAEVYAGNGSAWVIAQVLTGDGSVWS